MLALLPGWHEAGVQWTIVVLAWSCAQPDWLDEVVFEG